MNYTHEGLILDVLEENSIESLFTQCFESADLESPLVEDVGNGAYAQEVANRDIFNEIDSAEFITTSAAARQPLVKFQDVIDQAKRNEAEFLDVAIQFIENGSYSMMTVQALSDASPLGNGGWLLTSGAEVWFG
ncbi:MAG: hypothetical protein Q7U28_09295 [Aquabacterium sp.]|nr:hypothetical protein [Aquabacterium sp.]